jgi:predicted transcriptional regulator
MAVILLTMAIPKIKATYALDSETVRALERMARRWKVSKSEALRRAIRAAAEREATEAGDALAALDRMQQLLALTPAAARRWRSAARTERLAGSARREGRQG